MEKYGKMKQICIIIAQEMKLDVTVKGGDYFLMWTKAECHTAR
jgi:hypothetical protein